MAFNLQHFQFNRGVTSANTQGQGFTSVIHTYMSATDTRATIASANYFPPFIDGDAEKVFVGDALLIVGSDGTSLVMFIDLSPVVLGPDLLTSGPTLTIGAPIAPVDANALRIAVNVLQAQFATAAFPGIMSTASQTFSGIKAFNQGLNAFDIGVNTTHLNSTGPGPLELGDDGITSQIHAAVPVLVDSGIMFIAPVPETTLTTFRDEVVPVIWSGPFTATQNGSLFIQRVNNLVYLTIREIPLAAASNNLPITSGAAVVPVGLRPLAAIIGLVRVTDDAIIKVGIYEITVGGVINIYAGLSTDSFTGATNAGFDQPTIAYTLV